MSGVHVSTDMREFEGALGEDWCHQFGPAKGIALCGATYPIRGEHWGSVDTVICEGCGRRNCPSCQHEDARRGGS